jgi:hypothetical protein
MVKLTTLLYSWKWGHKFGHCLVRLKEQSNKKKLFDKEKEATRWNMCCPQGAPTIVIALLAASKRRTSLPSYTAFPPLMYVTHAPIIVHCIGNHVVTGILLPELFDLVNIPAECLLCHCHCDRLPTTRLLVQCMWRDVPKDIDCSHISELIVKYKQGVGTQQQFAT